MRSWPALLVVVVAAGCGRLGFDGDVRGDAGGGGGEAGSDGGLPPGGSLTLVARGSREVGASVHRLLIGGGLLYAATEVSGGRVVIYDLGVPGAPVEIGAIDTNGIPYGLELVGTRLYVATETGGDDLEIFDVSTPASPVKLGGKAVGDTAYRVRVQNERAYVTSAAEGDDLEIYDAADAAGLIKLGGIDLLPSYYVRGVDVVGTRAFTAGQLFNTIDVSDPSAPVVLGGQGFYWYAYDLQVVGDRAYALEANNGGGPQLRVFDISDVANPVQIGSTDTAHHYARDIEVVDSYAFTVCAPGGTPSELQVFDVSAPSNLTVAASAPLVYDALAVAVSGTYAYVGMLEHQGPELLVFEVTP